MKFKAYVIECITNLHVGSGDTNYGIVDKLVQRDPVTNFPTIHSTSLKGALREHFNVPGNEDLINTVFGQDGENTESGTHKFLSADLLALPVRCTYQNYVLGLNKLAIDNLNAKAKLLTNSVICSMVTNENKILSANTGAEVYAEEFRLSNGNPISFLPSINTHNVASLKDTSFDSLIKHLPVIARNRLGEDRNLWYEELVPHKTLFVTFIGSTGNNNAFDTSLTSNVIQIGANASVGYGLTKFYAL